jgi:hypothetical protein
MSEESAAALAAQARRRVSMIANAIGYALAEWGLKLTPEAVTAAAQRVVEQAGEWTGAAASRETSFWSLAPGGGAPDDLGAIFLDEEAPWCGDSAAISLEWDSWAVCKVTCYHGTAEARTDPVDLDRVLRRGLLKWVAMEHPEWCRQHYGDGDRCERWKGHAGVCGEREEET